MKRILIAPNAFKNALTADKAAGAIAKGLKKSRLKCETVTFPVGDGGDGTGVLIHSRMNGRQIKTKAVDPLGRKIDTSYSIINNGATAVIEMADISGIKLLKPEERNPLLTHSIGTGELIKDALDRGVSEVLLGMGGSATVDAGCGMLYALGIRFLDKKGDELRPIPQDLLQLAKIDSSGLDKTIENCKVTILCDVENYLLGEQGAASVFGPQKGASLEDVTLLKSFLQNFKKIVFDSTGKDVSKIKAGGTAGGAAAGMYALANAKPVKGIDYFLKLTHFEETLKKSDFLITGEGSLDEQTLSGKAPYGVAKMAKKYEIPVMGLAGKIPLNPSRELLDVFDVLLPINHAALSLDKAIQLTEGNLTRTAEMVGNLLLCQ